MSRPSLDDYVDVAERIQAFKAEHPDGSLQASRPPYILEIGNKPFVVYTAAAYRTPDDPRPGIGTAWEPFPGPTPYTKDSELMNAETAAWGRAIVALGFAASGKIASAQEVRARTAAPSQKPAPPDNGAAAIGTDSAKRLIKRLKDDGADVREVRKRLKANNLPSTGDIEAAIAALSKPQAESLLELLPGNASPLAGRANAPA